MVVLAAITVGGVLTVLLVLVVYMAVALEEIEAELTLAAKQAEMELFALSGPAQPANSLQLVQVTNEPVYSN
jgi:hypothetical protein